MTFTHPDFTAARFAAAPDATFVPAPGDGVLPDGFFSTTNLPTYVRLGGAWRMPREPRMDAVLVLDANGNFLRQWRITDMDSVHCMAFANDGTVYICNRYGNQIRLYDKMGNFKRTFDYPWQPATVPADGKIAQSGGATVALAFSRDPAQTFMFVVNQNNSRIDIVERQSGKIVSTLGQIGNLPGQFNQPHSVAVDTRNNLYIVENRGRRIHKFTQEPHD